MPHFVVAWLTYTECSDLRPSICRSHYAVLGGSGGYLIPKGNEFGKDFDVMMKKLLKKHRHDPKNATKLHVRRGVYVFDLACRLFGGQPEA